MVTVIDCGYLNPVNSSSMNRLSNNHHDETISWKTIFLPPHILLSQSKTGRKLYRSKNHYFSLQNEHPIAQPLFCRRREENVRAIVFLVNRKLHRIPTL